MLNRLSRCKLFDRFPFAWFFRKPNSRSSVKFPAVRIVPILPPFCLNFSACGLGLRGTLYAIIVNVGFAFPTDIAPGGGYECQQLSVYLCLE